MLFPHDPCIVGVATNAPLETKLPVFALDDVEAIASFALTAAGEIAGPRVRPVIRSVS